ncbi:MAG: hypothetical protein JOZ96_07770 [Acidobacteria bacterium]|nr:hypothetical protein [Acidobacteriota bacterium]
MKRHILGMLIFLVLLLAGLLLANRYDPCEKGPRMLAGPCPTHDPYEGAE